MRSCGYFLGNFDPSWRVVLVLSLPYFLLEHLVVELIQVLAGQLIINLPVSFRLDYVTLAWRTVELVVASALVEIVENCLFMLDCCVLLRDQSRSRTIVFLSSFFIVVHTRFVEPLRLIPSFFSLLLKLGVHFFKFILHLLSFVDLFGRVRKWAFWLSHCSVVYRRAFYPQI